MVKNLMLASALLMLTACTPYAEKLKDAKDYANVRDVGRGYIQYEIENGTVTCREHTKRTELTCWKNGNETRTY